MIVDIMYYLLNIIFILSLLSNVKSERKSIMPTKINNIQENKVNKKECISERTDIKKRIYKWLEKTKVFEWMEKKRLFELVEEKEYNDFILRMIEV